MIEELNIKPRKKSGKLEEDFPDFDKFLYNFVREREISKYSLKTIANKAKKESIRNMNNNSFRKFLVENIKRGDSIKVDKVSIVEGNYVRNEEYIAIHCEENHDYENNNRNYLRQSVYALHTHTCKAVYIPINDISWDLSFYQIGLRHIDSEILEDITDPNTQEYNGIDLPDLNYAYELEGGFENKPYNCDFEQIGFDLVYDSSAIVDAHYSEKEIVVDGYDRGENAISRYIDLKELLDDLYFVSSENCGIHVHVSNPEGNFTGLELIKISRLVAGIENKIFELLPSARFKKNYSIPLIKKNKGFYNFVSQPRPVLKSLSNIYEGGLTKLVGEAWYNSNIFKSQSNDRYHDSRYNALNIHSCFHRGTLEFRHFDADEEMIPFFIELVGKIVSYGLKKDLNDIDRTISEIKNNSTEYMLNKLNVSDMTKDALLSRNFYRYGSFEEEYEEAI